MPTFLAPIDGNQRRLWRPLSIRLRAGWGRAPIPQDAFALPQSLRPAFLPISVRTLLISWA